MAVYRQIQISFWQDTFVDELTTIQKFFYLYLLTNSKTTQCGCYEISDRLIEYETKLSKDEITELIDFFEVAGKISRVGNEILIINWLKQNSFSSPKIKSCIEKELVLIKNTLYVDYIRGILDNKTPIYRLCKGVRNNNKHEEEKEETYNNNKQEKSEIINNDEFSFSEKPKEDHISIQNLAKNQSIKLFNHVYEMWIDGKKTINKSFDKKVFDEFVNITSKKELRLFEIAIYNYFHDYKEKNPDTKQYIKKLGVFISEWKQYVEPDHDLYDKRIESIIIETEIS